MLVLSRKQGESFEFAGMEVVIRVISLKKSKVQLGIDAPRHIAVKRTEQAPLQPLAAAKVDATMLDDLSRLEAELAALAELATPPDRELARQIAGESIDRLQSIKRQLRLATRRANTARPISEFLRSRAESLSDTSSHAAESGKPAWPSGSANGTSRMREASVGYQVSGQVASGSCTAA